MTVKRNKVKTKVKKIKQNNKKPKSNNEVLSFLFEMIDSIAKTMSELEKIVIDYCSASDNSEKWIKDNRINWNVCRQKNEKVTQISRKIKGVGMAKKWNILKNSYG